MLMIIMMLISNSTGSNALRDQNVSVFVEMDLENRAGLAELFKSGSFDVVVNLAAQAGVRYSPENPFAYIASNIVGFINIFEGCRA